MRERSASSLKYNWKLLIRGGKSDGIWALEAAEGWGNHTRM